MRGVMKNIFVTIAVVLSISAFCCDTPVFRYSMERWPPSPYQVKILHKRDLKAAEIEAVEKLKQFSVNIRGKANTYVETIDLKCEKMPVAALPLQSSVEIQVSYPIDSNIKRTFWQKPLTLENAEAIIDSPVRELVSRHLTDGSPAVWLFFASSDQSKNKQSLATLNKSLAKMQVNLSIPRLSDGSGHPRVNYFPIVQASAKNVKEEFLRKMLGSIEPELLDTDEPMAFPIYGQGRALFALVGKGINHKVIKDHCEFVMGKCSCIVKEQNPGVDMLFNCDWSRNLGSTWIEDEPAPEVSGIGDFIETIELPPLDGPEEKKRPKVSEKNIVPATVPETLKNKSAEEVMKTTDDSSLLLYLIITAALAVIIITAGTVFMRKKS